MCAASRKGLLRKHLKRPGDSEKLAFHSDLLNLVTLNEFNMLLHVLICLKWSETQKAYMIVLLLDTNYISPTSEVITKIYTFNKPLVEYEYIHWLARDADTISTVSVLLGRR